VSDSKPRKPRNPRNAKQKREVCAGGVVYRTADGTIEVALAEQCDRLTGASNTRLAKGHVDPGETSEAAAIREVREEIGVAAEIVASLGSVEYTFREKGRVVSKEVWFYLMQAASEDSQAIDGEMQRMYWCEIDDAVRRLTFDTERLVMERAKRHLLSPARD
jgi:8-oxo-dGTP pyrophosphatase MutT (NUDIX family)